MSGKPRPISPAASAKWKAGDRPGASKLAKLSERQLYDRLGPPGRRLAAQAPAGEPAPPSPASDPTATPPAPPGAAVAPATGIPEATPAGPATDAPPPSEPEPTVEQIGRVDTRQEAEALYRDVRAKTRGPCDPVRYASLVEKALAALNRIEQIDRRRPLPPGPDEVTARIVAVHDAAIDRMGILTRDEAVAFARDREALEVWAMASLGPVLGAEVVRRLALILDGAPPAEAAAA